MMNAALVMPVRLFGRWEGFLHSWGCFRFFLLALLLCSPLVVLAQWEPDVRLTYNDSATNTSFNNAWCVAASGDTVHAVWHDNRDGNWEIYYKRSTDGGTNWDSDVRLTTNDGAASFFPSVASTGNDVHVVWEDNRDGNFEIYTKRSTDGGTSWDSDVRLTNDRFYSVHPSVAVSGSIIHVVWYDQRDGNDEIYTNRSTNRGTSWGGDLRLTSDGARSWYPSVAASGSNVHVVWSDGRDGSDEIYIKRSTDGGASWDPDLRLTSSGAGSWVPSVTASGSYVHVVWEDYRDGNEEIYTKRSTNGGTSWDGDHRLTNNSAYSEYPSVTVSGLNVHVVWQDNRDGNFEIYTNRSTNGGTSWGGDLRLITNSANSNNPSVATSGSKVHVVWRDQRDGNYEIYYKRNPTGNSGVGESSGCFQPPTSNLSFSVVPNPFSSFTSVSGHSSDRFALYDISGRKVGVYKGDRIGSGLSAGVYFLRPQEGNAKPVRVVKIR